MRHPHEPSALAVFIAWPAAASLSTLLSAALLLGGLWGVLAPSLEDDALLAPRWQVLAVLAAYLGALLAAVAVMCRARAGNPDAVASAVVGAALAVGCGVVLQLVAPAQPWAAGVAALAALALLLGLGRGFARVAGGGWGAVGLPLAALAAWACLWPAALGIAVGRTGERIAEAAARGGTDVVAMWWWAAGWGLLLALLAWCVRRARSDGVAADGPFLSGMGMRWTMLLVAAGCSIAALAVQAHIAGLDLAWSDCLPHLAALAIVGNELAARRRPSAWRDAAALAVPALAALVVSIQLPVCSASTWRGVGFAPGLVGAVGGAPGLPLLLALVGLLLLRGRPGYAWGAALAAALAVAGWDARQPLFAESGGCLAACAAVAAWRAGRGDLATAATAGLAACLPEMRLGEHLLGRWSGPAAWTGASAAILAAAAWRPHWVSTGWARLAAWALGLPLAFAVLMLAAGRRVSPLPGGPGVDAAVLLGALLLIAWAGWRRRDGRLALAGAPATAVALWPLAAAVGKAWLLVGTAFAVLGGAAWQAVRRARAVPGGSSRPEPPPASGLDPTDGPGSVPG